MGSLSDDKTDDVYPSDDMFVVEEETELACEALQSDAG